MYLFIYLYMKAYKVRLVSSIALQCGFIHWSLVNLPRVSPLNEMVSLTPAAIISNNSQVSLGISFFKVLVMNSTMIWIWNVLLPPAQNSFTEGLAFIMLSWIPHSLCSLYSITWVASVTCSHCHHTLPLHRPQMNRTDNYGPKLLIPWAKINLFSL